MAAFPEPHEVGPTPDYNSGELEKPDAWEPVIAVMYDAATSVFNACHGIGRSAR